MVCEWSMTERKTLKEMYMYDCRIFKIAFKIFKKRTRILTIQ